MGVVSLALGGLAPTQVSMAGDTIAGAEVAGFVSAEESALAEQGPVAAYEAAARAGDTAALRAAADELATIWLSDRAVDRVFEAGRLISDDELARSTLARALRGTGSLYAVRAAVERLGPVVEGEPDPWLSSLEAMTGVERRPARWWRRWWAERGHALDESSFAEILARSHIARAARAELARDRLASQLAEAYQRLYIATEPAGRPQLLAELMRAERESLRLLGYDLAEREAVSARPVGDRVIELALDGLADRSARVRTTAAELLFTVRAEQASARALGALASESDESAAAAMLRILVRQPVAEAREEIIKRLRDASRDGGAAVTDAAIDAALAYQRTFGLDDPADRDAVLDVLRSLDPAALPPAGVRLLSELEERGLVLELIDSPALPVAQAAAAALRDDPDALDRIVMAASDRPGLFDQAVSALAQHRLTAAGYRRASDLPAPSPTEREQRLTDFAARLAPSELLGLAESEPDLQARERILSAGVNADLLRALEEDRDVAEPTPGTRLVEALVTTRYTLNQPAALVRVVERLPTRVRSREAISRPYLESLIRLNRLDDAARADDHLGAGAVSAWLDGLRAAVGTPHAAAVAERIQSEFGGVMSAADAAALAEIESTLPAPENGTQRDTGVSDDQGDPEQKPSPENPAEGGAGN